MKMTNKITFLVLLLLWIGPLEAARIAKATKKTKSDLKVSTTPKDAKQQDSKTTKKEDSIPKAAKKYDSTVSKSIKGSKGDFSLAGSADSVVSPTLSPTKSDRSGGQGGIGVVLGRYVLLRE
jgi:hypothetical protein